MKDTKSVDTVGVIVGRWQVPDLHAAHKELIQQVLDKHPRVIIFVGLAPDRKSVV